MKRKDKLEYKCFVCDTKNPCFIIIGGIKLEPRDCPIWKDYGAEWKRVNPKAVKHEKPYKEVKK